MTVIALCVSSFAIGLALAAMIFQIGLSSELKSKMFEQGNDKTSESKKHCSR